MKCATDRCTNAPYKTKSKSSKYCRECLNAHQRDRRRAEVIGYQPIEKMKRKPARQEEEERRAETDRLQREHDTRIHNKYACGASPGRVLSREEIEAIAGTVTPIERIPKQRIFITFCNY